MKKVGIVIQRFNGAGPSEPTLSSLERASCDIGHEVYLAEEDGPAGVNNGIRHFLADGSVSHICILSPDVIVPDRWLDELTAAGSDAAAPVTNIAGNEQTIPVDIDLPQGEAAFDQVNEFALKRRAAYEGCRYESDMACFIAFVFTREVAEKTGLLDERFKNGYFADDDYCRRIKNEGFSIQILRDAYVHNRGSGPFSHILNDDNFVEWQKGQGPYEEKWGLKWQRRGWKLLKSCVQDAEFLDGREQDLPWARDLLIKGYAEHFNLLREESPELREAYKIELPFGENVRQLNRKILRRFSPSLKDENPNRIRRLEEKDVKERAAAVQTQALDGIRQSGKRAVCVLAPYFAEENSADGYIQRVKAIDEGILDGFFKVYVDLEKPRVAPMIRDAGENRLAVWLSPDSPAQAEALEVIIKSCGMVYVHSVLRVMKDIMPERLREELIAGNGTPVVWDVHGAVPEEYAMAGDGHMAELAGEAEMFLYEHACMLIVVTEAMKKHLAEKYRKEPKGPVSILPVFGAEALRHVDCSKEKALEKSRAPLAVYAGGLQSWQKIGDMQDLIEEAGDICRYAVFTPKAEEFMRMWGERKAPAEMRVESKTPAEVLEEYKACHYGFVLRDDVAVNNVACPTKLIEYLQYGIVPVMSTPNIGDFAAMGMEYIDASAFGKGELPDEAGRLKIAEKNYKVLKKLIDAGSVPVAFPLDAPLI